MVRLWTAALRLGVVATALIAMVLCCLATAAPAAQPRVVFVNPGKQDEPFWSMLAEVMQVAAGQLGFALDIDWARRDRMAMVDLGVAAARRRPDYLILVNEQRSAWAGMEEAARLGVKVLLLNNGFTGEDLERFGGPREKLPNYVGALLPDNVQAGRALGLALGRAAAAQGEAPPVELIAINGLLATPAAADRFAGLQLALAEQPQLHLVGTIEGDWSRDGQAPALDGLLTRHDRLRLIWAASDLMAVGALDAIARIDPTHRRPWLVAGLNWSSEGLAAVRDGRMVASIGGHFLAGGFALVMLRDYHDGRDFADIGLTQHMPFAAIDRSNVDGYTARFGDGDWNRIDFRALRRGPGAAPYRFDPAVLIRP